MSSSVRSTFISAEVILFFVTYCNVRPVLTYLRNPILASRWVKNLFNVSRMLRNWRVNMMFGHRILERKLRSSNKVRDEQKTGKTWFLIGNNLIFCVIYSHGEFSWTVNSSDIDSDRERWVENFECCEYFLLFHRKIDRVIWVRTTEFNSDGGDIAIIDEFNLRGVSNLVFINGGGGCRGLKIW